MSGFDPTFDAAGSGTRDGSVPAPGAIDGRTYFLRADKTWAAPGSSAPGREPPAPGPDLDQWACNVAGYLTYEVSRLAVKYVVDWLPVSWIGDVAGGILAGIAGVLLPASLLVDGVIEAAIFHWVSSLVSTHLVDIGAALVDDVAWAKIHCALYDKIKLTPTDLRAAILAFTAILGGLVGWTTPAVAAISYLFENLGIADVGNIPITAFVREYDCTTCATTGIGPTKPLLQTSFDLTVTDGSTADAFVDSIEFAHATISGTSPNAVHTPNTANSTSLGISKPDNTTVGVTSGVYAVLNGQLATINLDQYGAVAASASSGVTISGLVVGKTYALQNTGPAYIYDLAGDTALSFDVSVDGATWQEVLDYGVTGFLTGPTVATPSWAISAAMTDSQHARVVWVATATSVRFRASATDYAQASLTLGWQLLDVVYEGSEILVQHSGTKAGTRPVLNFVDSSTVAATVTDDSANDRVTVSLAATATGGGTVGSVTSVSGTAPVAVASGTTTPVISVGVFDGHGGSHPTGLVPDPGAGGATTTFLRADGTYTVPPGTGSGTVTNVTGSAPIVSSGGTTPAISLTTPLAPVYGGTGHDLSAATDGQIPIASTSDHKFTAANISGGSGITVTNSAGGISIAASGSGGGGTAMTALGVVTVAVAVQTVSITGISQAFTHLQVFYVARSTQSGTALDVFRLRINGSSSSVYDWNLIENDGTAATGSEAVSETSMRIGELPQDGCIAGVWSIGQLWIPFYTVTFAHKVVVNDESTARRSGPGTQRQARATGVFGNTAAVTEVDFIAATGNFKIGTSFALYGIA